MGMDVCGRKPKSKKGGYFRNTLWWWRPLAKYCTEIAPEITARCTGWQYNDGDGLNDCDSVALAEVLQEEINSGRCEAYAKIRTAEIEALPNEICECCDGAGVLSEQWIKGAKKFADDNHDLSEILGPPPDFKVGDQCHRCEGTGTRRPWACEYSFAVENVQEFVTFLRSCGGFSIW
jgi:hypothetical protein